MTAIAFRPEATATGTAHSTYNADSTDNADTSWELVDVASNTSLDIDMYTPTEVLMRLDLEPDALVEMVNAEHLEAYRVGGHLRFRVRDVEALAAALLAA